MQMWTNGTDTVIAESIGAAKAFLLSQNGMLDDDDVGGDWHAIDPGKSITVTKIDEAGHPTETRTVAEWVALLAHHGPFHFGSTEW